ncbi:Beta-galactosidase 17 [Acorus gramineus]|uniref:Beta-galactosidase 17 n=1 Tax=Acorus gramineus TaxID=55184 RepID=A0AAV9A390_ACOGR|nr:Beta-galactosidase 17 [Acorus gramineus]
MNQKPTRRGGRRKNHWVMMACKGSRKGKLLFAVLLTLSLWAFFPTIAPLPALSSSSPPSFSSSSSEHGIYFLHQGTNHGFRISDDMFWKDNQPFQIIGGDLHYFRVLPQACLDKMKADTVGAVSDTCLGRVRAVFGSDTGTGPPGKSADIIDERE